MSMSEELDVLHQVPVVSTNFVVALNRLLLWVEHIAYLGYCLSG